jgi:hypothetical protein
MAKDILTEKTITVESTTFVFRVQSYNFLEENKLQLKTYIEALEQANGELKLLGAYVRFCDLNNEDPNMWEAPEFILLGDERYHERKAEWLGDYGLEGAKEQFEKLLQHRLIKSAKHYFL